VNPKTNLLCNPRGFSLIEVVCALAVLGIGLMAVAGLQMSAVRNNSTGNEMTIALMLAEARIETLKNTDDLSTLPLSSTTESGIDANGQPGGMYDRITTVSNTLGGNFSRQIEVTVRWRRLVGSRSLTLSTLTHGNGI
jgi:type IV pilus assembly protein PilV